MHHHKQSDVHFREIYELSDQSGKILRVPNKASNQDVIMKGQFFSQYHSDGISMHCSDAIEQTDMSTCIEMEPGLSFNFLFHGEIDFSLGGEAYHLGNKQNLSVECSTIILPKPDILTRYMKKGQKVRKFNIFIKRDWLEKRCSDQDKLKLSRLFQDNPQLVFWLASPKLINLVNNSFQKRTQSSLIENLETEKKLLALLSEILREFFSHIELDKLEKSSSEESSSWSNKIRLDIENYLRQAMTLDEIANAMHISISTLQRRFKKAYGMTVMEYDRLYKLKLARAELASGKISIGEAAHNAGYKHPANFITAFKKQFSITPAELMKLHR